MNVNNKKIIELFKSGLLADVRIIITSSSRPQSEEKIEFYAHKFILFASCPYFEKLISFQSASLQKSDVVCEIKISIEDPHVLYDIVMSFYGIESCSSKLTGHYLLFEVIRCRNFLCLDNRENLTKLYALTNIEEDIDLLLELAYVVGYSDKMVKLIYDNLPEKYDSTNVDNDLLEKLLNYNDAKFLYFQDGWMIVKKYYPFHLISEKSIEYKRAISLHEKSIVNFSRIGEKIIVGRGGFFKKRSKINVYNSKTGELVHQLVGD